MDKRKEQLCWRCQNAYANKCCWINSFKPILGWKAKKTTIKQNCGIITNSYLIKECPNFVPDKKRITIRQIAKEAGISVRTYYRKKRKVKDIKNE